MTRRILLTLLLAAAPAAAQTPEARTAAAQVVDLVNPPAQRKAALDQQLSQMRSGAGMRAMLGQNPQIAAAAKANPTAFNAGFQRMGAIQADAVGPILREMQPAERQAAIDAYARAFTAAELNEIAAFYRTPTGAKLLARQRGIAADVQKVVAQKFGPRMQAAEKAAAPKLQAELQKLAPASPKGK